MEKFTWDDLYDRADGAAFNSPELNAKDEARYQINEYAKRLGEPDAEGYECPEEVIDEYANKYNLRFDEKGNIVA